MGDQRGVASVEGLQDVGLADPGLQRVGEDSEYPAASLVGGVHGHLVDTTGSAGHHGVAGLDGDPGYVIGCPGAFFRNFAGSDDRNTPLGQK